MSKTLFKLIIHRTNIQTVTDFVFINVNDHHTAISEVQRAIYKKIDYKKTPGTCRDEKKYTLFWLDDTDDVVHIKTWWDLHNYATFFAAQGQDYINLYVGLHQ